MRKYNRNLTAINTRKVVDAALMGHDILPSEEDYIISVILDAGDKVDLRGHWEMDDLAAAKESALIQTVYDRFGVKVAGWDAYNNPRTFLRWYNQMADKAWAFEEYQESVMDDSLEMLRVS